MSTSQQNMPEPVGKISDSPLFWVCMFASMGLMATVAIQSKFQRRQGRIQKNAEMRRHVEKMNEMSPDQKSRQTFQHEDELSHSLGPVIWFLSALVLVCWVVLVNKRVRLYREAIAKFESTNPSEGAES